MKIAVLKAHGDSRVAATPETVKKMLGLGAHDVCIESDAGANAGYSDSAYLDAGASVEDATTALAGADIVLVTTPPKKGKLAKIAPGAKLVGLLNPFDHEDSLPDYAHANVDAFAMELLPRITRAQSMDVLSSQANLAGYKAVVDAAAVYGRAMPMMMTAAGTVAPAKVFVMGAGVAGLQAIATARRLGAVVSATDVRYAAKEQVESLGGTFVTVDEDAMKAAETEGGYAKEMSADFQKRQADFVAQHLEKMDIVITTALIPGRPAPKLLTKAMVKGMKPGSVIVDLAAPRGGNVDGGEPGKAYQLGDATVLAPNNILDGLSSEASNLYARNLLNFVSLLTDKEERQVRIDWEDEIVLGTALTREGNIVHERFGGTPMGMNTTGGVSAATPTDGPVAVEIVDDEEGQA